MKINRNGLLNQKFLEQHRRSISKDKKIDAWDLIANSFTEVFIKVSTKYKKTTVRDLSKKCYGGHGVNKYIKDFFGAYGTGHENCLNRIFKNVPKEGWLTDLHTELLILLENKNTLDAIKHLAYKGNSYNFDDHCQNFDDHCQKEKNSRTVIGAELFGRTTESVSKMSELFVNEYFQATVDAKVKNPLQSPPKSQHNSAHKIPQEINIQKSEQPIHKKQELNPLNKILNAIAWDQPALALDTVLFNANKNLPPSKSIDLLDHVFTMHLMQVPWDEKSSGEQIKQLYDNSAAALYNHNLEVYEISNNLEKKFQTVEIKNMLSNASKYKGSNVQLEDMIVNYIEYLTLYAMHFPASNIVSEILSGNGNPKRGSKKFKKDYPNKSLFTVLKEKEINNKEAYELIKKYMTDALLDGNHKADIGFFENFLYYAYGVPQKFTNLVCSSTFNHYFVLTGEPADTPGYYQYKNLPKEYCKYNGSMLINCCGYLSRWAAANMWFDMHSTTKQCPKELLKLKENIADPIKSAYNKQENKKV